MTGWPRRSRRPPPALLRGSPSPAAGNLFDEQRRNRRDTWLLIAGFVALLAFIGFGFDLFVLGAAAVVRPGRCAAAPADRGHAARPSSDSARRGSATASATAPSSPRASRAPVTAEDASPDIKRLMNVVTEMAIAAGLPMPRVFLIDEPDPNAFATGRDPDHASIAVTTGLLETMNREELQGVIAHEMAHVRNLDIRKMTLVAALLGAVLLLSDWATRLRLGIPASRDSKRQDGASLGGPLVVVLLVVWLLTVLLTPLIGRLLATGVSRRREYLADASGAELTRNPLGLASALRKLEAATAPTPQHPSRHGPSLHHRPARPGGQRARGMARRSLRHAPADRGPRGAPRGDGLPPVLACGPPVARPLPAMRDSLLSPADLSMGARLIGGLPRLLRHPIRIEEARATLEQRLERREADFLDLIRWGVYENPVSPYRELLRLAGCEFGDLERLVARQGLEEALGRLCAHGVYLTVDELKGRSRQPSEARRRSMSTPRDCSVRGSRLT